MWGGPETEEGKAGVRVGVRKSAGFGEEVFGRGWMLDIAGEFDVVEFATQVEI